MFHVLASSSAGSGAAALGLFGAFWGALMLFYCLFFIVAAVFFVIWLWMLIDCLRRDNYDGPNDKLLWALVILFAGIIGAAIYYFVIKTKKDPQAKQGSPLKQEAPKPNQ